MMINENSISPVIKKFKEGVRDAILDGNSSL